MIPLRISFLDDSFWEKIFEISIDIYFGFDIIVNFCSAYENELGILIFDRKDIAMNYLKTWFILDLLSW